MTALKSAWDPYTVLPPSIVDKLESKRQDATPFAESLHLSAQAIQERVDGKFLQLDPPKGKVSDQRKEQLEKRKAHAESKKLKRAREGELGLLGRRKKKRVDKDALRTASWDTMLPLHQLWLQYIDELLGIPIASTSASTPITPTPASKQLLPSFPSKHEATRFNVQAIQNKLVKAEFVGARLKVNKSNNKSLQGLDGIVVQETQGTFKVVTTASKVKVLPKSGSVFTMILPLKPKSGSARVEELSFDIYGDSVCYRSTDRVSKKWKNQGTGVVDI